MSNRDWDRELADLDRRLAAVPDPPVPDAPAPARRAPGAAPGTLVTPDTGVAVPPPKAAGTPAPPRRRTWRAQLALLLRIVLGAAAVAALVYWPFSARCGAELSYYLALVAALGLVGVSTSASAWRHRSAFVHLLGLAMLAGAVVLGAREVLPKVGYAIPSADHPATWTCAAPPPATTPTAAPAA